MSIFYLVKFFSVSVEKSIYIVVDPDPDRYQFQANDIIDELQVLFLFIPENFNMLSKILKIMTHLTLMRKINHCKLVTVRNAVTKHKF